MKVSHPMNNLNAGEISPLALGRFDIQKYTNAVETMENFLGYQLGGASFRPGTVFVNEVKDSTKKVRLIPFQYSTVQSYIIEMGDLYMRFYANNGQVQSGGVEVEVVTPYAEADIFSVQFTQSSDTMYLVHPSYPPQKLTRTSSTSFSLTPVVFIRGPFMDQNITDISITASSDTGFTTLTASCPNWVTSTFYNVGDFAGFPKSVSGWVTSHSYTAGDYASYVAPTSAFVLHNTYKVGDYVTYGGSTYQCILASYGYPITHYAGDYYPSSADGKRFWAISTLTVLQTYICLVNHTSGTFSTDLSAGKWQVAVPLVTYKCLIAHTSGTFATDLSASKWVAQDLSLFNGLQVGSLWSIGTNAIISAWATGTGYTIGQYVFASDGNYYCCIVAHTSGTFATDVAAGKWSKRSSVSGVVLITGFTSAIIVTGVVQNEPGGSIGSLGTNGSATKVYSEGSFSTYRGFPSCVTFYQQRLLYAMGQYFYGSVQNAYDDFAAGSNATDAYIFQIASTQSNAIRWMSAGPNALEIGTTGGTFSNASTTSTVTTPTNININPDTSYGAANIMPKRISSFLYYIQRNLFQMRELTYDYLTNREKSNDMCLLADHILRDGGDSIEGGAVDMDHQQSPNDRIWVIRGDGEICVMTRNPEQEVVGWNRLTPGTTNYGPGEFRTVAIIQVDGGDDQVWVVAKRNINGTWKRYIEYFSPETFQDYYEPVRLDCSLTYDSPVTISGITKASHAVVTATSHGFSNGDQIKIDNVIGMTEVNTNIYIVADKAANYFSIKDTSGSYIDSTGFSDYKSGGEVRKMVTAIPGLSHLEGETVSVQVDGGLPSSQQTYTVSSGSITLAHKAAVVHVGLSYTGKIRFLPLSDGSHTTGQTKNRRIYLATVRMNRSLGLKMGQDDTHLETVYFKNINSPLGHPPDLFTGDKEVSFTSWWDKEIMPVIVQSDPIPLTILAIVFRSEVEERG